MCKENNYAFIDSQNLNLGVRGLGWKLDFAKFRIYLKDKCKVSKAYLFIGYVPANQSLYTKLQQDGYICVFKPTLQLPNGKVKGNVDAELVLYAMVEYPNYDKSVIVSGDGDFCCLIEYLKKKSKLKNILIPNHKAFSSLLKNYASDMIYIDGLRNKVEYKKA